MCFNLSYLRVEFAQLYQTRMAYFSSIWNVIQSLGFTFSLAFLVRDLMQPETGHTMQRKPFRTLIASMASFLLVLNCMYYLRGIVGLGSVIKIYMRIISS